MDYQEFLNQIRQQIKDYLPQAFQDTEISINKTIKNNVLELDAIFIRRGEDRVVPQIYLNGYFELYENGVSMSEILKDISASYLQHLEIQFKDVPEDVMDYEKIKSRIMVQLINRLANKTLLENIPYKELENTDLAAILIIQLQLNDSTGTIRVTNELLSHWGVNLDPVYHDALAKTIQNNPARIQNLEQIIMGMLHEKDYGWQDPALVKLEPYEQYVLSNQSKTFGASVLLYPDVLKQLANNSASNFFILPSSIHELILLQETAGLNAAELQAMVLDVNQNNVESKDKLSDEVYYYDRKAQTLSMATVPVETAELVAHLQNSGFTPDIGQEPEIER